MRSRVKENSHSKQRFAKQGEAKLLADNNSGSTRRRQISRLKLKLRVVKQEGSSRGATIAQGELHPSALPWLLYS